MNRSWFEQLANQAMAAPAHPDPRFPPSPYYRFLRLLATNVQPKLSVELGVCGGGGSLHLAMGWEPGVVVGIDHAWDHAENVEYVQGNYKNFHFWRGDSIDAASRVYEQYGKVGIVFIDTIHEYQRTWDEFNAWLPYLARKAVVCFDDLRRKEMLNFWDELPEPKIRLDMLHSSDEGGFGVWWKDN